MLELLGHGAEGRVYTHTVFGRPAVVKERAKKSYRVPALDAKLTKQRIIHEARCMDRARRAGLYVPCIYSVNIKRSRLIMERINGKTLKCVIEESKTSGNIELNLSLATKIGNIVAQLHDANITHGDLTTSNMMATYESNDIINENSKVVLIDFGLAANQASIEEKAVDLYVLERAIMSTHPHSESIVKRIIEVYRQSNRTQGGVLERLEQVRARGRKREMVG